MPLRLKKRGKIWHISGTVAGRTIRRSSYSSDKAIAERKRAELEAEAWKCHLDGPNAHVTFAQAILAYLEAEKSDRFLAPIAAHWKDTPLRNITAEAVRQSAFKLYPNAKGATRNRQVIVPTQAIINHAAGLNWCSPMKVKRFPIEVKIKQIITPNWAKTFAAHTSPHLGALCILMLGTAARISQALALQWRHIDLEAREARIPMSLKNHEEHVAHLPQEVIVALANIPSDRDPDEYVFGYAGRDSVTQPWANAVKRAKLPYRSPHCCRHGFATLMLRAGFDVKTVAERGGRKDASIVLRTYAHAIADRTVTDAIFCTKSAQAENAEDLEVGNVRRN